MTHEEQDTYVLDFPGATALKNAGRTEPPDPAVLTAAHALLRQAMAADTEHAVPATPATAIVVTPRFGRRRLLACAAAVAAVAAGVAILPVVDVGSEPAASVSAADLFNSMADRAASGTQRNTPYWKTTVKTWVEGDRTHTDEYYLSRNALVIKTQNGRTVAKKGPRGGTSWSVGNRQVSWDNLDKLPTRPDALRRLLSAGAQGASAAEQTVRQSGELLTNSPASPRLRAALYRVLADTPGAEVTERVKDGAGRIGTEISWKWSKNFAHSPHDPKWIVRPSDGQLLEIYHVRDDDAAHVTERDTYLYVGPADSLR
ncbi:hypothetical protein ACFRIC_40150 [Streptomyces sp. NPDC056738]|uniref:hypothetical protein n=1 Tax=Streptomyces sp. NPDC056738 TaxID=3345933 RepID=UPI00367CB31A